MAINWNLVQAQPRNDQPRFVGEAILNDNWTMTDVIMGPSGLREIFVALALGQATPSASRRDEGAPTRCHRTFKIRVLKGAKIYRDGVQIWNVEPKPGDVVKWKTGPITTGPTGKEINVKDIADMKRRGLPTVNYRPYTIGPDGCIDVTFEHAYAMLMQKGRGVVMPEFAREEHTGGRKSFRALSNWWFEEARPGDEAPKRRRRVSDDASPENNEA